MNRKPIFDAVRTMLGRGFTDAEVRSLDAACVAAEGSLAGALTAPTVVAKPSAGGRKVGDAGLALIQSYEGCAKALGGDKYQAYPDPGSTDGRPWTIGWGSTGKDILKGTIWTRKQCDDRFRDDIQGYADAVSKAIGNAPTTQNQFDALVSFHYNTGAIASATLTKKHRAGDYVGARAEFARWNKNAGKVMAGLVKRRAAEAALYAKP